jgi:signal transduction histidine kinase
VLLVEDNNADAHVLCAMVEDTRWGPVQITRVASLGAAAAHLAEQPTDVVLLDLGLPDAQGLDAVRKGLAAAQGVPLLILTGLDDGAVAEEALKEGAQDYLIKGEIDGNSLMRALHFTMLRRRMQVEVERAHHRQLALKDEFLSHVSHELRSPLAAIDQFASILQDGLVGELSGLQREYLGIVLRNVRQLHTMIEDLLDVTRAQVGKLTLEPQRISAGPVIADAVASWKPIASGKHLTLASTVPGALPPVHADPHRVRQILANLIDNAITFTGPNGRITVGAEPWQEDPGFLRIWVSDTGRGMAPEATKLVFERLFQAQGATDASRKGLGLGLYICRELAVRQGGRIWVESTLGAGSTFSFVLPVFSLANLVGPLLTSQKEVPRSIALVVVHLAAPPEDRLGSEWDAIARESYRLVQRCVLPDLDVVLPRMEVSAGREAQFIVAVVNESGAGVLARRLREQLCASPHIVGCGVAVEVDVRMLKLAAPALEGAAPDVGAIVALLEQALEATLTAKAS